MAIRKIELMHKHFGVADGKCKDCRYFSPANGGYSKCNIYGRSCSEATDWSGRYQACGLKNVENPPDVPVVKMVRPDKEIRGAPVPGQYSLFD